MNRKIFHAAVFLLLIVMMLCGCGRKSAGSETAEPLSDEQALSAVRNCCCAMNPDLKSIVEDAEYPVYWDIHSSDEHEIVILFRSYTGAQNRYHIDRITGDTYVTEFVPGITLEEQRTDERFNVRDYLSED